MKKIIHQNDESNKNFLQSNGEKFIFPKHTEEGKIYGFIKNREIFFISRIENEKNYKIVNLNINQPYSEKTFKTLRGAIRQCLKSEEKIYEFENIQELLNWFLLTDK